MQHNDDDESKNRQSSVKQILAMIEQQIQSNSNPLPTKAVGSESQASNSALKIKSISQKLASTGSDSISPLSSSNNAMFPPIPAKPQALRSGSIIKKFSINDQESPKSTCRASLNDYNNLLAEVNSSKSLSTEIKTTLLIPMKNLSFEDNRSLSSSKMIHPEKHDGFVEDMDNLRIAPSTKEMEFDDFNHKSSDSVKEIVQNSRIHKLKHISQSFVRAKHQTLIPDRKPIPFLADCLITAQEAKNIMRNNRHFGTFEPHPESSKSSPIILGLDLPKSKGELPVSLENIERNPIILTLNKSALPNRINKSKTRKEEIIFQKNGNTTSASADTKNDHVEQSKIRQQNKSSHANNASKKNQHDYPKNNSRSNENEISSQKEMNALSDRGIFEPYISLKEAHAGLQNKTLLQGIFRLNRKNRHDAYVSIEKSDQDIYIPGWRAQNRALNGDIVLVSLMEGDQLKLEQERVMQKRVEKIKHSNEKNRKCERNISNDNDECESEILDDIRVFGKVVCILESLSFKKNHVGTISLGKPGVNDDNYDSPDKKFVWFKPSDNCVPLIKIFKDTVEKDALQDLESLGSTLCTCVIKRWNLKSPFPVGSYTGKIGQMGQIAVESEALLVTAGVIWDTVFSDEVLDSLPQIPWCIPEAELDKRWDLRKERIFSIDPQTARDLDDAVSIKKLDDDIYQIGVHIADVSFFVQEDTLLDAAAFERGTSVYLVQKVIPMLPRLLCEELCSLNPGVDRLAFSVTWKVDSKANFIGDPEFGRSIIKSCAKLSYDHAQSVIDGGDLDPPSLPPVSIFNGSKKEDIEEDIRLLFKISKLLRERRFERGTLSLNSIKLWFTLDDDGNPTDNGIYKIKEANKLIEEFMLLANIAVSHKLANSFPEKSLLRSHPPPLKKQMVELAESLTKYDVNLDVTTSKALNDSLENIPISINKDLLRLLIIKNMKRAEYYCTGVTDVSRYSHYALGVPLYTHFTSPIRRYCDLVVHRMLDQALNNNELAYTTENVANIAKKCNAQKNIARNAQDASQKLFLICYLSTLSEDSLIVTGHVNKIGTRSIDVVVFKYGIEQTVWIEDILEETEGIELISSGMEVHWKGRPIQRIEMFSEVLLKVSTFMDRSPPFIKLLLLEPTSSTIL